MSGSVRCKTGSPDDAWTDKNLADQVVPSEFRMSSKKSKSLSLKGILSAVVVLGLAYAARHFGLLPGETVPEGPPTEKSISNGAEQILAAFRGKESGMMLEAEGTVKVILSDDTEPPRHQRFIVELRNRHTVLIAHNIDLAKRVPLEKMDSVTFRGQYEWNEEGGVIHWTHKDPRGRHDEGWIRHAGLIYE